MRALYVTAGAAITFFDFGTSGTQLSLNGGVGKRVPYGAAATRLEGFLDHRFKGGGEPSGFAIGARIGLSLWH